MEEGTTVDIYAFGMVTFQGCRPQHCWPVKSSIQRACGASHSYHRDGCKFTLVEGILRNLLITSRRPTTDRYALSSKSISKKSYFLMLPASRLVLSITFFIVQRHALHVFLQHQH